MPPTSGAGWSSLAARRAHNPKVVGSNPTPATTSIIRVPGASRSSQEGSFNLPLLGDEADRFADFTNGYRLPAGVNANAKSVFMLTAVARKAGFDQSIV